MAKKKKTSTRSSKTSKSTAKKPTTRKSTSKKAASAKPAPKKKTTKKVVKKVAKKTTKKATTKKVAPVAKPTKKKTTKVSKPVVKKSPTKKPTTKKSTTKKATTKKKTTQSTAKPVAPAKVTPTQAPGQGMTLEQALDHDWTEAQLRKVKTGLSKKDLQYFLSLLLEKRAEIIGNIQGMETTRSDALSDIAHMPLHMADVGSDNFEQEFTLGLMESERKILREINDAIIRMQKGIYGVCLDSGQPINRARLEIKPWAKYCIEVARMREKRGW